MVCIRIIVIITDNISFMVIFSNNYFSVVNRNIESNRVHNSEPLALSLQSLGMLSFDDGFHHSIQVPSLPKAIPLIDSICRTQSPR